MAMQEDMKNLPPIPVPWRERWRTFRMRLLPALVFAAAMVVFVQLWREHVAPAAMLGEVVIERALLASPADGLVRDLQVRPFDSVRAGDYLGELTTTTPGLAERTLAVLAAEIAQTRVGLDPVANQHRNRLNYEGLRLDALMQRVNLAIARVNLAQAERDHERVTRLYERGIAPEDAYEEVGARKRALAAEVRSLGEVTETLEARLADHDALLDAHEAQASRHLAAAVALLEERVALAEAEMAPIPLVAPRDGVVGAIERGDGEYLLAGEPILYINVPEASRIVAYVRPRAGVDPEVGSLVEVRKRDRSGGIGIAEVLGLGAHLEPAALTLNVAMRVDTDGGRMLPVLVSMPPDLSLRPGEIVDLLPLSPPRPLMPEWLRAR